MARCGAVRLRSLDVSRYTNNELRQIFWGLGQHLGLPLYQNMAGEIMGEVRDETRDAKPTFIESEPGKVVSSRARARSTCPLRFHSPWNSCGSSSSLAISASETLIPAG